MQRDSSAWLPGWFDVRDDHPMDPSNYEKSMRLDDCNNGTTVSHKTRGLAGVLSPTLPSEYPMCLGSLGTG